ncbi:hypothetical protein [Microbacterium elymi]|uniref:Integral membrane protein n=1 Tax=Microbacterium elymi TaxID=2909587 RepID=A0ABY5NIW7_9MICO|nr:hypothetical protein [Microbacterium elymi]UUT35127.1 hypothetical protein L2X98_33270 [Microbacterium elymi]
MAYVGDALARALPMILAVALTLGTLVCAAIGVVRARRGPVQGLARDVARWLPVGFTLAQGILFVWMTQDLYGDEATFLVPLLLLGISVAATVLVLVWTRTRRRHSHSGPGRVTDRIKARDA